MKTKRALLKLIVVSCCTLATTTVFGTPRTWTGGDGTGIDIGAATNWGGTLPGNGDTAQWDGVVAGNLSLTYNGGIGGNFETTGCSYNLTANQTGSVLIRSAVSASANLAADHITNSSPAGTLQLGDGTANVLNIIWRADGGSPVNGFYQPHFLLNNSSSPNIICPNVRFQAGGGNQHILRFGGSGDWIITNNLATANGVGTSIVKQDAGTLIWAGPSIAGALGNSVINTPVDIEGGTLILRSSGVLGTQRITNNATLRYDAVASQTLSGPIDGSGLLMVSAGTLTLSSGISDFSGNIILTNGGTLVAGGNQNVGGNGALGTNGAILFNGGTLQFSAANTFDYSPRFSTAAGQAYSINSGGQNVTFTNDLTSSGATFTKAGSGTLTLAGTSSYSGLTTVSAGKLVFQGMKTGSGNITVANSTSLGVTTTGTQVTPNTLTVGTSSSATLEFNSVSSTTTALIAAGTVSAGGTITVNVNSGSFTIGQDYPLFSWSSGSAPAVTLGTLTGAGGNLITNGSAIKLHITSLAFVWTGLTDGNWDTTTANDWKVNGVSQVFNNGGTALFDDTATGQTNITLNAAVSPASVTVNSTTHPYSITSGGANLIGGSGGLTKNGNSTLTLSGGVNTYSGATTISGGTLSLSTLANGGTASDIGAAGSGAANLVLNGGTLLYTGGAQDCDHLFTLGTGNGAINSSGSGALNLNNGGVVVLSGSGARALTLSGTDTDDNTLSAVLGDNGGATSLAKTGAGKWVLTGNNTNSGTVTISAGTLQVGTNGPGASLGTGNIVDNGSLIFNNSDTLTNGTVSGTGTVTVNGDGTVVLPGDNTYSGAAGTVINNGTLQVGIGGATGKLTGTLPIVDNGTIILNSTGSLNIGGFSAIISGSGNLIKRGSGLLAIIGNNNYSGWTTIDAGAQLQVCDGNQGQFASSVVTNSGSLIMDRQDNNTFFFAGNIVGTGSLTKKVHNGNSGDVTLTGNYTYTGGTYILGGAIIFGDGSNPGNGSFIGDVFLTNDFTHNQFGTPPNDFVPATLTFNRPDDLTFPGNIVGQGSLTQQGGGTLTLTGNNTYTNNGTQVSTTISAGTVQVGNGGTSGSLGGGTGSIADNGVLVFNRSDAVTRSGGISGTGSLVQYGSGTLTLTGNNTYTGSTTVSNGTLAVSSVGADVNVYSGATLVPGTVGAVGALTIPGGLNITSGSVSVTLNESLSLSNSTISVGGAITCSGGTLKVANVGPGLHVGDQFTIFNQPVSGITTIIPPASITFSNGLAVDGSITVLTAPPAVNTNPTNLTTKVVGNQLTLAWPADHTGWHLQAQTNLLSKGLGTNWVTIPGTDAGNSYTNIIGAANGTVFYRMVYP